MNRKVCKGFLAHVVVTGPPDGSSSSSFLLDLDSPRRCTSGHICGNDLRKAPLRREDVS